MKSKELEAQLVDDRLERFAAAALTGLLAGMPFYEDRYESAAEICRKHAEAMLAELDKAQHASDPDAARYRFLNSDVVATDPVFYPFWQEFDKKLCRGTALDALIDKWRHDYPVLEQDA